MKATATVFGSKAESAAYTSINSEWNWRFNLYLSLPFPMVIDFADGRLTEKEKDFLLKTSLDFTLTDKLCNRPLLSVEFDGLGSGFSYDGVYHPAQGTNDVDPYRKLKLDLKLRVAEAAGYPLVVVAYKETNEIHQDEQMTVLDGVIGQVLAEKWFASQGRKMIEEFSKGSNNFPEPERSERLQDAVWDAELFTKLLWNPIFRRAADLLEELVRKGLVTNWRHEYLSDRFGSPAPATVKVRVSTDFQDKEFSETIELRNTNVDNIDVMEIAESIGRLRVFGKVLKAAGLPLPPCTRDMLHATTAQRRTSE